jgi:hypothetical protein
MPFTPLHLGPGLVFKAIGRRHFSFMVFGGSQVMMDIEPLIGILRGWSVLHGWTHTLPGALAIGSLAGLIGRPISERVLRWLDIGHPPFTWRASFIGAYVGTFSHVALDAIMHADMNPLRPFAMDNPLLGLLSIDSLHLLCLGLGVIGAVAAGGQALVARRR